MLNNDLKVGAERRRANMVTAGVCQIRRNYYRREHTRQPFVHNVTRSVGPIVVLGKLWYPCRVRGFQSDSDDTTGWREVNSNRLHPSGKIRYFQKVQHTTCIRLDFFRTFKNASADIVNRFSNVCWVTVEIRLYPNFCYWNSIWHIRTCRGH